MRKRNLGNKGPKVSALGLGCMSIGAGGAFTSSIQSQSEAADLVHRALDLGINFFDTADMYGGGESERQVGAALKRANRDEIVIATKFGFVDNSDDPDRVIDGRPKYVREACDASLRRLGVDYIDLYYLHRVDRTVPIEETVGSMAQLAQQGKVRCLGLSEVTADTVRRGHSVHPIAAVQNEYSLWSRDPEQGLLPLLSELGIALVAWGPLGRGFLAGRFSQIDELSPDDSRRRQPRFEAENIDKNAGLRERVEQLAGGKNCTLAQLVLAWLIAKHDYVIPIPGTSSIKRLEENAAALEVRLSEADLESLEEAMPRGAASGARLDASMLALSES
jgi:aryl-alcohol dehydrogenase-like predicted oxidoreductase